MAASDFSIRCRSRSRSCWARSGSMRATLARGGRRRATPGRGDTPTSPNREEPAMTGKADFNDEEWAALRRAPLVAGMAITLADPGRPIEVLQETSAAPRDALADA